MFLGCATLDPKAKDTLNLALCALGSVPGRLDLIPAGPGVLGVRVVTLDRSAALSALEGLDDSLGTGIAKVRVEPPRPMVAIILHLVNSKTVLTSGLTATRLPISLAVEARPGEHEDLEVWAHSRGTSLVYLDPARAADAPPSLVAGEGVDLRAEMELESQLSSAIALAERYGAAWVYGDLNGRTVKALSHWARQHGDTVHLVGYERVSRPPTTPRWRRRCTSN